MAKYSDRSVYSGVSDVESFQPYLSRIESIQLSEIEAYARGIPVDWLSEEAEAFYDMVQGLYERRSWIRQGLIEGIERERRTFPNWS